MQVIDIQLTMRYWKKSNVKCKYAGVTYFENQEINRRFQKEDNNSSKINKNLKDYLKEWTAYEK